MDSTSHRLRRPPQAEESSETVERERERQNLPGLGSGMVALGSGMVVWRAPSSETVALGLEDGGVGLRGRRDRCPARRRGRGRRRLGSAMAWRALIARRWGWGRRCSISLAAQYQLRERVRVPAGTTEAFILYTHHRRIFRKTACEHRRLK
jgi:hypothetical protein